MRETLNCRLLLVKKTFEFVLPLPFTFSSSAALILRILSINLLWSQNNPLVLLALDDFERVEEMFLAVFDRCGILLIAGEVRVDELDQPVQILRGDLWD